MIGQRAAFDVSHRKIVDAFDLADVIDGAQVRMPQRCHRSRLAKEPLHPGLVVRLEFRNLDGDQSPELFVLCEIDRSHRSFAENSLDFIAAK